ncbi:28S ribosomal protein S33, mitochondrial [Aethina tumida]|uniref:28S ribosomal protein S33, mitochondrial n=1 Tax=Aethina tumida TaxID=116153 RepID=UPI00096B0F03|nr:28S ribosomal protein S33, mitochondrial [Aethina tumida]
MSNYTSYIKLGQLATEYSKRMTRLSNRIFGEVARPTNSKSMKVVKMFSEEPVNLRREVYAYYPRHIETGKLMMKLRHYGLYRDEHADFKDEMARMRELRGKAKAKRVPSYLRGQNSQ